MSLLNRFPHKCSIFERTRQKTVDGLGAAVPTDTVVFEDATCWVQQMSAKASGEYQKQGFRQVRKVYFTEDLPIKANQMFVITFIHGKTVPVEERVVLEVITTPSPDAGAGTGTVWKVIVGSSTNSEHYESTIQKP